MLLSRRGDVPAVRTIRLLIARIAPILHWIVKANTPSGWGSSASKRCMAWPPASLCPPPRLVLRILGIVLQCAAVTPPVGAVGIGADLSNANSRHPC